MKLDELDFDYPERLVATERAVQSRVMLVEGDASIPVELARAEDLVRFVRPGDLWVLNDTRVLKRRVFSASGLEILFLNAGPDLFEWEVLCPSTRWKSGERQTLPGDVDLELIARGRPQRVRASRPLDARYFEAHGEMPLPPYIQKARGERRNREGDASAYQTAWAEKDGSLAAPTASLHFSDDALKAVAKAGARVAKLTLHVGLGTFLPIAVDDLSHHAMHAEEVDVPADTWRLLQATKTEGGRVWALGTTVTRALEAAAHGELPAAQSGGFCGATDLFIRPGFEYRAVDCLMTNFHQPRSTLLALVAAFAPGGLAQVKACYRWAIERDFRLFSYGDLSAWIK